MDSDPKSWLRPEEENEDYTNYATGCVARWMMGNELHHTDNIREARRLLETSENQWDAVCRLGNFMKSFANDLVEDIDVEFDSTHDYTKYEALHLLRAMVGAGLDSVNWREIAQKYVGRVERGEFD